MQVLHHAFGLYTFSMEASPGVIASHKRSCNSWSYFVQKDNTLLDVIDRYTSMHITTQTYNSPLLVNQSNNRRNRSSQLDCLYWRVTIVILSTSQIKSFAALTNDSLIQDFAYVRQHYKVQLQFESVFAVVMKRKDFLWSCTKRIEMQSCHDS